MRLLFLFDIDGTLLNTGGLGLHALRDGFCEEFGRDPAKFPELNLHGATDRGIAMGVFDHFQIDHNPENETRFFDAYLAQLGQQLTPESAGEPLPGVLTLLDVLRDETNHAIGLLTGNIVRGAHTKVDAYGIGADRFPFGAFGDDHHDRNQLGPIGIERAKAATGVEFAPEQTLIIGDTPKDIACARACGARAVAVATGGYNRESLEPHDADLLLDDLVDALPALERVAEL